MNIQKIRSDIKLKTEIDNTVRITFKRENGTLVMQSEIYMPVRLYDGEGRKIMDFFGVLPTDVPENGSEHTIRVCEEKWTKFTRGQYDNSCL